MQPIDTYERRRKRETQGEPDVFVYDRLSLELRRQIAYILLDMIKAGSRDDINGVHHRICREFGEIDLCRDAIAMGPYKHNTVPFSRSDILGFVVSTNNLDRLLSVIEMVFVYYKARERNGGLHIAVDPLADELNKRFFLAGVGYQIENNQIVRVDSKLIHKEVVKPALALLANPQYSSANKEFMDAFADYRKRDYDSCVLNCGNAFESTMKVICTKRGWKHNDPKKAQIQKLTAKELASICIKNNLLPSFLQTHFSGFQTTLEDGIGVVRNKGGAHGKGTAGYTIPEHLAKYQLYLTASTIMYLIESEKALP